MARKVHRYNQRIADELCERVMEGESLTRICAVDIAGQPREDGTFPRPGTVYQWCSVSSSNYDPAFTERFAEAVIIGQHVILWGNLDIADTPEWGEEITTEEVEHDGGEKGLTTKVVRRTVRKEMTAHRQMRINTRMKTIALFNPKLWSDKLRVAEGGNEDIEIIGGLD